MTWRMVAMREITPGINLSVIGDTPLLKLYQVTVYFDLNVFLLMRYLRDPSVTNRMGNSIYGFYGISS